MANNKKDRIKIAGYAKRVFFNDNIEYRDFSPDLVGFQLTSEGGTPLFTNGNFSIDTNLDPKPDVVFRQGTQSPLYTLDDVVSNDQELVIEKNIKTSLNLDLTNPLSYIWYGSASELIRASLEEIQENWPAAIYVDNKVGSITGNNITNYVYDITNDESTFTISTSYFSNPYSIKYTLDEGITGTEEEENPLRNFTVNYKSYVIEHNGIIKKIKDITPATQTTNSTIDLVVEGNPFPELTGIIIPQFTPLVTPFVGSIPFFIKPNEIEIESFFTSLNDLQQNLLDRNTYPIYTSIIISPKITDEGVIVTTKDVLTFPILDDGYNLNFFDSYYLSYLDTLSQVGENYDENNTDLIIRKYTAEVISSFDTVPRGDGNNLVLDGEKATKLLRIYGVSFDEIKKYINGIKFAHVVTYDKKNNVPDALVKDLVSMLGLDPVTFVTSNTLGGAVVPVPGLGSFSGASASMSNSEVDTELYRRLILNIAWLWKSKGSRKAVEFLFRFIGAPEALVNFNEYIVIVDKPLDMDKIKQLLLLYTGKVDTTHIPYDDDGFPLPPVNGDLVIVDFIAGLETGTTLTGNQLPGIVENPYTEMYFQKAGGWYKETFGPNAGVTNLRGNNPHVGKYDGGNEYLNYFMQCYIPNFTGETTFAITETISKVNHFINYNYGIFNGVANDASIFTEEVTYNVNTNQYQNIDDCLDITYNIIETPVQNNGKSTLEEIRDIAEDEYNAFLELIKVQPYLQYSPEFIKVKNNYIQASNNYNREIATENCDINQTLEICIVEDISNEDDEIEDPINCCDGIRVDYEEGFLVLFDEATGIKLSGDRYACCCESQEIDGQQGKYISYNEGGEIIEYCAVQAPCDGNPIEIKRDGTVVFEMVGNNMPNNIFLVEDSCYQVCDDGGSCYQYQDNEYCSRVVGADVNTNPQAVAEWAQQNNGSEQFFKCFTRTTCKNTTTVSRPECCAWHGYESKIVQEITATGEKISYVVCVDSQIDGGSLIELPSRVEEMEEAIAAQQTELYELEETTKNNDLTSKENQKAQLEILQKKEEIINLENQKNNEQLREELGIKPSLEEGYDKYIPYSNRNAPIQEVAKISTSGDAVKRAGIVKPNSKANPKTVNSEFYSVFEDPDVNDPTKWEDERIDNYGRVAFSTTDNKGDKIIIDWNTPKESGGELYNLIGQQKGYEYDTFKVDTNNSQLVRIQPGANEGSLPYNPNNNATTTAVVVPNRINCEEVSNVTVLFGSENDLGFQLPNDSECECSVDITFDYMLKYNAANLIQCASQNIGCEAAIINDATLECIWCKNFLTFTNSQTESSLLEQNYGDKPNRTEELQVWQSDVAQQEPNVECCNAAGGTIVPTNGDFWDEINDSWANQTDIDYMNLVNGNTPQFINMFTPEMQLYQQQYSKFQGGLNAIFAAECIQYSMPPNINCCVDDNGQLIDPSDYITTQNVCALPLSVDCGIYSNLIYNYQNLLNQFNHIKLELENCVNQSEGYGGLVRGTDELIVETETNKETIKEEGRKEEETIDREIEDLNRKVDDLDTQIQTKENDNSAIKQSLTETSPTTDCSVYEETLKQLNNFDVDSFCKTQTNQRRQSGVEEFNTAYNDCVKQKTASIEEDKKTYSLLLNKCRENNEFNEKLIEAKNQNNQVKIDLYEKEIQNTQKQINNLTDGPNGVVTNNEELQGSAVQKNDVVNTIDTTAALLGKTPNEVTDDSGRLELTDQDKISLEIQNKQNDAKINQLNRKKEELVAQLNEKTTQKEEIAKQTSEKVNEAENDLDVYTGRKEEYETRQQTNKKCCLTTLNSVNTSINGINANIAALTTLAQNCYDTWYNSIQSNLQSINISSGGNYISYIDDIKLKFKLFVDNNGLTNLPYTNVVNPIWEWDPTATYSGVYFDGTQYDISLVEQGILDSIIAQGDNPSTELFTPNWSTLTFNLPDCVCKDLRTLYPDKRFKIGIEIENYECAVCLLVDNIRVDISDCDTQRNLSLNNCLIPELSCVIDNRKSWVYTTEGLEEVTIYPDGECNSGSTNNYDITKLVTPQNRLWQELEYRYTEYDLHHSDLLMNTKSATFSIDPANAIECDVYNFWKNINCDECPTSCDSGDTIVFEGELLSGGTLVDYSLPLSGTTPAGLTFSCDTYTTILQQQVTELKNDYYSLTANYSESINASYSDLLNKGGSLSGFEIEENNCGSSNLIIGDNNQLDNLFGVITENEDGTISFWETYLYDTTTPYTGGVNEEIFSGITAQTFNQTTSFDSECCQTLNNLITANGINGLGVNKEYVWNNSVSACTWMEINNCEGDCEYSGVKNLQQTIPGGECYTATTQFNVVVTGTSTGYTAGYCVAPLSLTPAEDGCELIETTGATLNVTNVTAYTGSKQVGYSVNGTRWYSLDLNTADLPYNLQGSSTQLLNNSGVPVPVEANVNSVNSPLNTLWVSQSSTLNGRLNNCSIWGTLGAPNPNPPIGSWIGFSYCIQINDPGTYTIGIGADNRSRFYLNGDLLFTSTGLSGNDNSDLSVWKVFEIDLPSGEHVIAMEGRNDGDEAGFGAEIYSATTNQLTGMTTTVELDAVTLFSTKDYRSDVVGATYLFEFGTSGGSPIGYSCPAGYTFTNGTCYGSPTCVKITTSGLSYDITATTTSSTVTVTGTTTICEDICVVTGTTNVCINPLDYLEVAPSEIKVKEVFDDMVLSNLIDAKSRQVISNYPLLQLFYQLYLNASNCGVGLGGNLTYNSLFQFMDKIGDYWLDLLEQVVPATTIWEGCDNSGKIYRNTIFDQNKYAYRKYTLNFNDSVECPLSGITSSDIGSETVDVQVIQQSLYPENATIKDIIKELTKLQNEIYQVEKLIDVLKDRLCACEHLDPDPNDPQDFGAREECIESVSEQLKQQIESLEAMKEEYNKLNSELNELQAASKEQEETFDGLFTKCTQIGDTLTKAEKDLDDQYVRGTLEYERQRNYIAGLKDSYEKCKRKSRTQYSNYDTVFITHINNSNEFEGSVTVIGDPEWEPGGYFYNSELIHDCNV